MKHIIIACLLLFSTCAFAQTFKYSFGPALESQMFSPKFVELEARFITPDPEEITFMWERIQNTMPTTWSYSLCDHNTCYISIPATGKMARISLIEAQTGTEGLFKLSVEAPDTFGVGIVELYVYDSADYSRGDTVSLAVTYSDTSGGGTASVINLKNTEVLIYPNPAAERLHIVKARNNSNYSVSIYNLLGNLVYEQHDVNSTIAKIDVSNLWNGVYLVSITDDSGDRFTKRVVVRNSKH